MANKCDWSQFTCEPADFSRRETVFDLVYHIRLWVDAYTGDKFTMNIWHHNVCCTLMSALALAGVPARESVAVERPNFIVINIDDLGYGDIQPYGSKLNRTPNLNRMAEEGRKLTCFYATVCHSLALAWC